ncbi:MAG TPA: hypothetical protein GX707_00320 [Epulopiscium sp.]|nr:hypothetical protein [Candidatus Epulonipiscium sp.]
MKLIINKIKAKLTFNQWKKTKIEYTDLAPIDKIESGAEYLNALDWALSNKRIKNIALAGPYGSGKSSIIETYLKQHPIVKKKTLRISMATFVENVVDSNGKTKKIKIKQEEIELGILKQLFYKVGYKRIPQSRYRKLHRISWNSIFEYFLGLSIIIYVMSYIFSPELVNSIRDKIIIAGSSIGISNNISLLLFGVFILVILAILATMYRSMVSHFKVKEIKFPVDTTVKRGEESNETIFDKHMDEIIYFFEETKYRLVFFEDLDRLEDSSIFVHLRELNTLLNNYNVIKEPIIFVYAIKDDIFTSTDRTKFFEFIIPVIPIINSTNSGEILLKKLDDSDKIGIKNEISQDFVLDVSPYISDMRILQNIYNEFIVYKKTLRIEQGLKLLDEPMMALIIFKNLYPHDFADIQMEQGIIKQAFANKQKYLKIKQGNIQSVIDESTRLLDGIQSEALKSIKELKSALLCEVTDWTGIARVIKPNRLSDNTRASVVMENDFDVSEWSSSNQCSGTYYGWDGSGGYSFSCSEFSEICASYLKREKRIKLIEESRIAEEQRKVEKLKLELQNVLGWSLKRLTEQFGAIEILSDEVRSNKLLVFLLRRGYIDEKYANYINYFKGNTVTKEDMNFILAVKNMEPQPFNYTLIKTTMVAQRLQTYEFGQKTIYNFNLLECMLSSDVYIEKLNTFMKQLAKADERSWKFIDEFVDLTERQGYFIRLLAAAWPDMWGYIAKNAILTYERKIHYLTRLISNLDTEIIVLLNSNNEMSDFIEQNEDILQQLTSVDGSKIIAVIEAIQVKFRRVLIENVAEDVLDYIFDNNYYELNPLMIERIVEYKDKDLVSDLESKHYTTIIKLEYIPLIEYVRANISQYIELIVLAGEHACDEEEQILDLLERSIENQALCISIIEHEEFCMVDITCCCKNQIAENKLAVKNIWGALLKNNKILPQWENVMSYWSLFEFTQDLISYIDSHINDLMNADSQCINDDFIRGFIASEITDEAFEVLLPFIRMDDFDINLNTIAESKVSIMIGCKYFEYTVERYEEINSSYPDLCAEFILQNQANYIDVISDIQMDFSLLENLLFSEMIEVKTAQILLDIFGTQYMTNGIAENLKTMELTINLEVFNAAWEYLLELDKQKLMLEHLDLLSSDDFHSCFTDLERFYSGFIDRSKRHDVRLSNTSENQRLAERLEEVEYITSHQLSEKKEYDSITETEKIRTTILCRVKAIK